MAKHISTEDASESIAAHFSDGLEMRFSKEQTIINGYNEPDGVYLIKSGFVKAYSVTKSGHVNLLIVHQKDEFIPLPWALDGAHKTGLFYEALSDVTVMRASKDKLRAAMGTNTWLAKEVLKQAVDIITAYTQRIQTLELRTARERIISQLIYYAERFGKAHSGTILLDVPITHQDLADSINMTRETASRALEQLFSEKIIEQNDHQFMVVDIDKLQSLLN